MNDARPEIEVAVETEYLRDDLWRLLFSLRNLSETPVGLLSAWMPHAVLRAAEEDLTHRPFLSPGHVTTLRLNATYTPRKDPREPSNPFLILRARWRESEWRVLVQLAVVGNASEISLMVAAVNAHRIGFSKDLT